MTLIGAILLILAIVFIVRFISKHMNIKVKITQILVVSYVCILIIGAIIYLILPIENIPTQSNQFTQDRLNENQYYDLIYNGQWDDIPEGLVEKKEWQFEYTGPYIEVQDMDPDVNYHTIEVERKSEDDGMIEITVFSSMEINYDGIIYKAESPIPSFELSNQLLEVHPPLTRHQSLVFLENNWSVLQFSERNRKSTFGGMSWGSSHFMYLHMKVPQSLEVRGGQIVRGDLEPNGEEQD